MPTTVTLPTKYPYLLPTTPFVPTVSPMPRPRPSLQFRRERHLFQGYQPSPQLYNADDGAPANKLSQPTADDAFYADSITIAKALGHPFSFCCRRRRLSALLAILCSSCRRRLLRRQQRPTYSSLMIFLPPTTTPGDRLSAFPTVL